MARPRRPFAFFALVFALSTPFWIVGWIKPLQLLPGLPVSAIMSLTPVIAAAILSYQEGGTSGVLALLGRAFDFKRVRPVWYIPAVLLMPSLTLLSYCLMRLLRLPLPRPEIPLATGLLLFIPLLVGGLAEELGWSGYATDPLQHRWGALRAAIIIGCVWAGWHIVPLVQVHRPATWIGWWALGTVGSRILIVWLYNNTGRSVFAAALYHAVLNLSWQLFPNRGSHYDPRITAILILSAGVAVTLIWGPQSLARNPGAWLAERNARPKF